MRPRRIQEENCRYTFRQQRNETGNKDTSSGTAGISLFLFGLWFCWLVGCFFVVFVCFVLLGGVCLGFILGF